MMEASIRRGRVRRKTRVIIYGAGVAGELVVAGIAKCREATIRPVAFVDDDAAKAGRCLAGLPVEPAAGSIRKILKKYKAERVLIAIPSAPGRRIREIHQKLLSEEIPAWIVPGILSIVESNEPITTFRTINPEDFLRRHPRVLGKGKIEPCFKDQRVLVTGAGGTIGAELVAQLSKFGLEALAGVDHSELAVYRLEEMFSGSLRPSMASRDTSPFHGGRGTSSIQPSFFLADLSSAPDVSAVFDQFRPTVVFHAAAYKHVRILERRPRAAILNNVAATRRLVDASETSGVHTFVHISTDKAVRPASLMGATKRAGELIVRSAAVRSPGRKFISVRFGNVIGSSGSVFPKFVEQIVKGGPVTVSDPRALRYFMLTSEAVELVLLSGAVGRGGKIYLLDIGEPLRITELVNDLIRFFGKKPGRDIQIEYTGLAPGEKLVENLYDAPHRRTNEEYILEVVESQKVSRQTDRWVAALLAAAESGQIPETYRILSLLVPEYRPMAAAENFERVIIR